MHYRITNFGNVFSVYFIYAFSGYHFFVEASSWPCLICVDKLMCSL